MDYSFITKNKKIVLLLDYQQIENNGLFIKSFSIDKENNTILLKIKKPKKDASKINQTSKKLILESTIILEDVDNSVFGALKNEEELLIFVVNEEELMYEILVKSQQQN